MGRINPYWIVAVVSFAVLNLAAGEAKSQLSGTIEVDGSSTVAPISTEAADRFGEEFPNVKIPVGISGTGGGFKRFAKGDTDISDASRPIKLAELEECRKHQVAFYELPIAYDGLTIAVHKKNSWVKQLTVQQLSQIFLADSAIQTWDQLDPSWPKEKIMIFSPGTDSGTFDYFKEVVAGAEGSIRADISVSEDDNNLVQAIANTEMSIGFFGVAYYLENKSKLRAVPIVNTEGKAVLPNVESIGNGSYAPFSRPLFIYVNAKSARRPEVRQFVKFYLENAEELADEVGYVGLPERVYEQAKDRFQNRKIGTHYLDTDNKPRHGAIENLYVEKNLRQ